MRRIEAKRDLAGAAAALLRALRRFSHFDAATISAAATWDGDAAVLTALGFLRPHVIKRNGLLSEDTLIRIRHWFDRVEDRDINGLRLTRDRLGWCRVERAVGSP